MILESTRLSSY